VTFATVTEVNPRRGLVTQTEGLDEEQLTKVFQRARGGSSRLSKVGSTQPKARRRQR
jgi:hypothetical protein